MSETRTRQDIESQISEDNARLGKMTDDEIDYSDIPPIRDWTGAVRGKYYRPPEGQVMLPIDHDLMAWFRESSKDYLTAINDALREHMERHRKAS